MLFPLKVKSRFTPKNVLKHWLQVKSVEFCNNFAAAADVDVEARIKFAKTCQIFKKVHLNLDLLHQPTCKGRLCRWFYTLIFCLTHFLKMTKEDFYFGFSLFLRLKANFSVSWDLTSLANCHFLIYLPTWPLTLYNVQIYSLVLSPVVDVIKLFWRKSRFPQN